MEMDTAMDVSVGETAPATKTFVWQPVRSPPKWCDLNPLDDWGVPEFSRRDLATPLFQRRAEPDRHPPSIYNYEKFWNRYLQVSDMGDNDSAHGKVLLGIFERHMTYIRLICHKLKTEGNSLFLKEVHFMLRALVASVRQFAKEVCFDAVSNFIGASLIRFNSTSVYLICKECYFGCADILRLLAVLQEYHATFQLETQKQLFKLKLWPHVNNKRKRKKRGTKSNLSLYKKSTRYRNLQLLRMNHKMLIKEVTVHEGESSCAEECPNDEECIDTAMDMSLPPIPCSPIGKCYNQLVCDASAHDDSEMNFSFLQTSNASAHPLEHSKMEGEETRNETKGDSGFSFADVVDEAFFQLKSILKTLLYKMEEQGHLDDFSTLLNALHSGLLPVDSLPLLLCYEVARFKSLRSTTCMTYSPVTMQFWQLMYKMLGGAVTRALSGPKNISQVVRDQASRGKYDPSKSKINFAVPSERILGNIPTQLTKSVPPGIIRSTLDIVVDKSKKGIEFVLSFDSKMVGKGLSKERDGDVDMWGYERPNLEKSLIQKRREIGVMESLGMQEITCIPTLLKKSMHTWKIISCRLKALRKYIAGQQKEKVNMERKIKNNPDNAKKYSFGLSKINANIYLAHQVAKEALTFIQLLTETLAHMRGCEELYQKRTVLFGKQMNCFQLLPPVYVATVIDIARNNQYIKQGTPNWLLLRQEARLTGSTCHSALGLRGLPEQKRHYNHFIMQLAPNPPDSATKSRMEHGTSFEAHAVATLCGGVAPSYIPSCYAFFETGAHWIHSPLQHKLIEVSPDGFLQCAKGNMCPNKDLPNHFGKIAVEIKCPYPKEDEYMSHPHYEVPMCYVIQLLLEMKVLATTKLWFVSSTKLSTTITSVTFNDNLYSKIFNLAEQLYAGDGVTFPAKLNALVPSLKNDLKEFIHTHCKFLVEVPTLQGMKDDMVADKSPYCILPTLTEQHIRFESMSKAAKELSMQGTALIERIHNQMRQPAEEVGVFMISDSDRVHDPDDGNSWPLAYIMKGKQMNATQLRCLLNRCLQVLHDHKVTVLCTCVDGQWSKLCFRDEDNKPLTRLALQKDTWSKVGKLSKRGCLKLLRRGTCPYAGDLDLLSLEERQENATLTMVNLLVKMHGKHIYMSSTGGPAHKHPIIPHVKTLEAESPYWCNENGNMERIDAKVGSQDRKSVIGLHDGESNILCAIPAYFITEILGEEPSESYGTYCFAHLETVLKHSSFKLLDDIAAALAIKNPNWLGYSRDDLFPELLQDAMAMHAQCTVEELRLIIGFLKKYTKRRWMESNMVKVELCNCIARAFGSHELIHGPKNQRKRKLERKMRNPKSLSSLAEAVLLRDGYPVMCLRISIARGMHITALADWEENSPHPLTFAMPPNGEQLHLFSQAAVNNDRKQMELITMDVTHMLTNLRTNVLRGNGFAYASKDSWRKIADNHPNIVSWSLIYDNADCQSAAFAKRVFSHAVEEKMIENGDLEDANFVRQVRNWYSAADMRGVTCHTRMEVFHDMHMLLTRNVNFADFPPPGAYVNGIPIVTYQAILQNIDSRIELFGVSPKGAYNQRMVGTLPCESAFADMVHLDKDGLGAPKSVNIPRIMSKVTHLNDFKHNPNKPFVYHTSHRKVYPIQVTITPAELEMQNEDEYFKDHFFDQIDMHNPQSRRRRDDINQGRGPLRGVQGIRKFYKVQENLIPEEQRLGIRSTISLTSNDSDWLQLEETG